ncbi:MAG: CRISPR-associated protein Csx3 [bacterium]
MQGEKENQVILDLRALYGETAKLAYLHVYLEKVKAHAGEGNETVLTGAAPVWLYLKIAHALHGKIGDWSIVLQLRGTS